MSSPPARPRDGGAVPLQPPAPCGISMVRLLDDLPCRLHSAVADTSEIPSCIRAWKAT
jgi:hypothetical protein